MANNKNQADYDGITTLKTGQSFRTYSSAAVQEEDDDETVDAEALLIEDEAAEEAEEIKAEVEIETPVVVEEVKPKKQAKSKDKRYEDYRARISKSLRVVEDDAVEDALEYVKNEVVFFDSESVNHPTEKKQIQPFFDMALAFQIYCEGGFLLDTVEDIDVRAAQKLLDLSQERSTSLISSSQEDVIVKAAKVLQTYIKEDLKFIKEVKDLI